MLFCHPLSDVKALKE